MKTAASIIIGFPLITLPGHASAFTVTGAFENGSCENVVIDGTSFATVESGLSYRF